MNDSQWPAMTTRPRLKDLLTRAYGVRDSSRFDCQGRVRCQVGLHFFVGCRLPQTILLRHGDMVLLRRLWMATATLGDVVLVIGWLGKAVHDFFHERDKLGCKVSSWVGLQRMHLFEGVFVEQQCCTSGFLIIYTGTLFPFCVLQFPDFFLIAIPVVCCNF